MQGNYYHTKDSVEEYIKLASGINGQKLIDELRQHLPNESSLLELGSGPGTDWEILSKSYQVTGSDLSDQFLNHLTSKFPAGQFIQLDAVTLKTNTTFDGVYSNKVLHHLTNKQLKASITQQYHILNPEGIVCHSFWSGIGSETYNGLLVTYQNKESLKKLFSDRFTIISIEKYKEFDKDDSLLLLARKKDE